MQNKKIKIIHWISLLAIIIIAFFLRIHNIDIAPAGIYPDEAVNGQDALLAEKSGEYKLFYTDNNGREGLYINLIAWSYKLFGVSVLGLKFPSIVFGVLTVLGVFLLTKELFRGSWRAGLIAAYMTTFSFWAINFSRIAFRAVMLPTVLVFSFYFLFRGIRTKNYVDFIFSGLIFGIGIHTYIAFRIAPLILVVLFAALLFSKRHFVRNYWKQALVFMVAMMISAVPMLWDFYSHPEYFESRSASISVFSPEINEGNLPLTLAKTVSLSLIKYNFIGDQNWRHNYPPYPVLHPAIGISFLIGIIYVISKFFHLAYLRFRHDVRDEKLYIYAFLLAWFFSMLIPEFMTGEGLPHALRSIGTLPVVYILATIPILWILGKERNFSSRMVRVSIVPLLILTMASVGIFNTFKYHVFWANNPKQHESFKTSLIRISDYLKATNESTEKIIFAENMQRVPIRLFNYERSDISFYSHGDAPHVKPKNTGDFEIIFTEKNDAVINLFKGRYPSKILRTNRDGFGNVFYVLK